MCLPAFVALHLPDRAVPQLEIPPLWRFEREYLGFKKDLVPLALHKAVTLRRTYSM